MTSPFGRTRKKFCHANPRRFALHLLDAIETGQETLDQLLDEHQDRLSNLDRRDLNLVYAIVYGVLRWRSRLDWVISHFSKTRMKRIHPTVLNILRMALFQILFLDRIPPAAAVNTAVDLAKKEAPKWVAGFVNGVLRQSVKKHMNLAFPPLKDDPAGSVAVRYAFPEWLVKKWLDQYGLDAVQSLCEAMNRIPPITLRTNTLKTTRKRLMKEMTDLAETVTPTVIAPHGLSISKPKTPLVEMPPFKAGLFQVQDEAAQLISHFLNPQPGETILDACSGMGGKTGHLAQLMGNTGRVVSVDSSADKLTKLSLEMDRLGITVVSPYAMDLTTDPLALPIKTCDRVLLDAPCSGLGVIRRNPDAKWRADKKNLTAYAERQTALLDSVTRWVKPSGILVYTVCSMAPEENEQVINEFLNKHHEFVMDTDYSGLPAAAEPLVDRQGCFRSLPHLHDMDGFFAVRLRKKDAISLD